MKKKLMALLLAFTMAAATAACSKEAKETETAPHTEAEQTVTQEQEAQGMTESQTQEPDLSQVTIRVGSLKGPTSMGLVKLMDEAEKGETACSYTFTMAAAADEITTAFVKGDLDIILVPANVASVLYQKTGGQVVVLDINTLGVLYLLETGETIQSVKDLEGKTIYLPGKGTTPDYALQYLLARNDISLEQVDLQYKSEGTEVISALAENPEAIGLLPQPAATVACMQNEALRIALNLTKEWDAVSTDSTLVTGVTISKKTFVQENPDSVAAFLAAHKASAAYTNEEIAAASEMVAALGIVPKAPIAAKAIPLCNITYIDKEEMQAKLSGYLEVLYGQNPTAIGGAMPETDFYYMGK